MPVASSLRAVLAIAGTDSSGGAGLTRDARVLAECGVEVLCAVTAVTAQTDAGVEAVHHVPAHIVRRQIAAAFDTRRTAAVKIGMLGTRATVEAVAAGLQAAAPVPVVLDPVLLASSGGVLLDADGRAALLETLFPLVTVFTPNIPEAALLLNEKPAVTEADLAGQAERLLALGAPAVLLKGGHGNGPEAVDLLLERGRPLQRLAAPRLQASRRGTGCALASALAANLAAGLPLMDACRRAKHYVLDMLGSAR